MLVYVISKNGQPLMPTGRCGKVRRMLKTGNAVVVNRCPFTIQLLYNTTEYTQPITLGVDASERALHRCKMYQWQPTRKAFRICFLSEKGSLP